MLLYNGRNCYSVAETQHYTKVYEIKDTLQVIA